MLAIRQGSNAHVAGTRLSPRFLPCRVISTFDPQRRSSWLVATLKLVCQLTSTGARAPMLLLNLMSAGG